MLKTLLSLASVLIISGVQAQTTYNGNGGTGFGGPVGQGTLTFSSDGTTLFGTITTGGSSGGTLGDDLVIYIDSQSGGFTTTSTFTDTGGGGDTLRRAISGYDGTLRSTVNFTTPFAADFAIGISPIQGQFGGLFGLTDPTNFSFIQSTNLTPTANAGPYMFSISLASIGVTPGSSFSFATTYGNFHSDTFRSNEAFGNTITDVTTPANTGNLGQDTGLLGVNTFTVPVPEPSTVALAVVGAVGLLGALRRRVS